METKHNLKEPRFSIRITIGLPNLCQVMDETVYWRYNLSMDMMLRYRWYFEYLAALLKVRHPKRIVKLDILNITNATKCDCAECGNDYIRINLPKRLAAKKRELGKYTKDFPQDLFGFKDSDNEHKAERIRTQIRDLENGIYDAYVPPVYINKMKKWLLQP